MNIMQDIQFLFVDIGFAKNNEYIVRRVHTAFFSKRRKKGSICKHVDKYSL